MADELRACWPYYGNKRGAATLINGLLGRDIKNMVVPFAGALGEFLVRDPVAVETVNDLDGLVVNAWRAIKYSPARVALLCDEPVHEVTLHARHDELICGAWTRAVTKAVTTSHGLTGVSLDPTYDHSLRSRRIYRKDDPGISAAVRAWALERGPDPKLRITLAGKWEEHDELLEHDWTRHPWRDDGEVIWASPHCLRSEFGPLFAGRE